MFYQNTHFAIVWILHRFEMSQYEPCLKNTSLRKQEGANHQVFITLKNHTRPLFHFSPNKTEGFIKIFYGWKKEQEFCGDDFFQPSKECNSLEYKQVFVGSSIRTSNFREENKNFHWKVYAIKSMDVLRGIVMLYPIWKKRLLSLIMGLC